MSNCTIAFGKKDKHKYNFFYRCHHYHDHHRIKKIEKFTQSLPVSPTNGNENEKNMKLVKKKLVLTKRREEKMQEKPFSSFALKEQKPTSTLAKCVKCRVEKVLNQRLKNILSFFTPFPTLAFFWILLKGIKTVQRATFLFSCCVSR